MFPGFEASPEFATVGSVIMNGMLGYGPLHYRYASGREGEACKLSIASNASYISLYCFAADDTGYVAERYFDRLPAASIGKSCAQFKRLTDLDEKALVALIEETAKTGLVAWIAHVAHPRSWVGGSASP